MLPVQSSSFHSVNSTPQTMSIHLLDQECLRLIEAKQPLDVSHTEGNYTLMPYPLRLLCGFYHSLSHKFQQSRQFTPEQAINNPRLHNIKYPLFKIILTALQKKLFLSQTQQKFYEEISYLLAFKSNLVPFFMAILSENTNYIPLERVASFYRALTSDQFMLYLPIQLYYLFGGSLFTIESKGFKEKVVSVIENIAKALSHSDTFISRNIEFYKTNKERKMLLDQSVKVVILAKNKEMLRETASGITNSLFGGREYLNKEEFLHKLSSKALDPILTVFLLLLRSEFVLFEDKAFQHHLAVRSEASKTNFYTHEMTKLFNKCPWNGDERCNCKKCQCVRRNRESAKLNQQKKRYAVEQVDTMKKQLDGFQDREKDFQRKISQLEQQNMMLKTLLKQIKYNHTMKSSLLETIEPISKVLNNEM